MFQITDKRIEDYLFQLASKYDDSLLIEMEKYGRDQKFPIIDRLVGAFIHMVTLISGAKKIFELGSGYGYSAYWFTRAMGSSGKIICTDGSEENRTLAEDFLSRVGTWEQMDFHCGEAIHHLKDQEESFDIVYNDIDKGDYPAAWQIAKDKIKPGGLYICDNTLWFGRVTESVVKDDVREGWTDAIKEHNKLIFENENFDATLVPIRDGVIMARKKC